MSDNIMNNDFIWKTTESELTFPMDFTLQGLEAYWKELDTQNEIVWKHCQKITDVIADNEDLEDFYLWMRYANPKGKSLKMDTVKGVPSELEPFFRIYMKELYRYDAEEKAKNKNTRGKKDIPKWTTQPSKKYKFERALCKSLYSQAVNYEKEQAEESATEGLNELFWYRRLFENEAFQDAVSSSFWEQEYDYRCKALRELSLQLSQEEQISQLKHAIIHMDTQIASMLYLINKSNTTKGTRSKKKSLLKTFPKELIEKIRTRRPDKSKKDGLVEYLLHNFEVTTTINGKEQTKTLQAYVDDLKTNQNIKDLRKAIRPYYLKDACNVPEKPGFQQKCEELETYIDTYIDDNRTEKELRDYIIKRCVAYYEPFFKYRITQPNVLQSGYNQKTGADMVIDEIVAPLYTEFYWDFHEQINYICMVNQDIDASFESIKKWLDEKKQEGNKKEELYKEGIRWHRHILQTLGKRCFSEDPEVFDGTISQPTIDSLVCQLLCQCEDAYYTFGKEKPDWVNEASIRKMWSRHNEIINISDDFYRPVQSCREEIQLYAALLICNVRRESQHTCNVAESTYKLLSEYIRKRKGGS